jgi:hypothetical protein
MDPPVQDRAGRAVVDTVILEPQIWLVLRIVIALCVK